MATICNFYTTVQNKNESQSTNTALMETHSAAASFLLIYLSTSLTCFMLSPFSQFFFYFFIFYPYGTAHTLCTVQYFCALLPKCESPSFPTGTRWRTMNMRVLSMLTQIWHWCLRMPNATMFLTRPFTSVHSNSSTFSRSVPVQTYHSCGTLKRH